MKGEEGCEKARLTRETLDTPSSEETYIKLVIIRSATNPSNVSVMYLTQVKEETQAQTSNTS